MPEGRHTGQLALVDSAPVDMTTAHRRQCLQHPGNRLRNDVGGVFVEHKLAAWHRIRLDVVTDETYRLDNQLETAVNEVRRSAREGSWQPMFTDLVLVPDLLLLSWSGTAGAARQADHKGLRRARRVGGRLWRHRAWLE